jgi:hypothetical protein
MISGVLNVWLVRVGTEQRIEAIFEYVGALQDKITVRNGIFLSLHSSDFA